MTGEIAVTILGILWILGGIYMLISVIIEKFTR